MGTEIAGKPHTSPLVGDEKVPLSPDGFATTQEIADLGGGGTGLPPQWSDGGNGDVTATVDDPAKTPFTIQALAGQDVTAPQLLIKDELGHETWSLAQEPDAAGITHHVGLRDSTDSDWNALFYIHLDNHEAGSDYHEAAFGLGTATLGNAVLFDTFWNQDISADNYTQLAIRRFDDQTVPIVTISEQVGNDRLFVVGKAGAIGTSAGEPADGDINAGECFRFFDPTNGAAAVKWKGKSADGTIVTRSVPLTLYDQNAFYSGNDVSVPNNSATFTFLAWDSLDAGIALLDLTDPEHPSVLTAGIYSVTASIYDSTEFTPGGGSQAVLHLDRQGLDAVCEMTYGEGSRADGRYLVSLNNTFYIPAGGEIAATIMNADGVVAHDVRLREVIIQRVG